MSTISDHVVTKLTGMLPLTQRQAALAPELRQIHREFLRSLVERGRPLTRPEIAAMAPGGDATSAIWTLAANDLIVLDAHNRPVGAYPVTLEETPHVVNIGGNSLWAMCAFDAVSVAPMFGKDVTVSSRCPVTGAAIHLEQKNHTIVTALPSRDVQVGVWWRDPGAVAARNLCPGIVFLRDRAAAEAWQAGDPANREFAGLEDAVEAGSRFFSPLIGREKHAEAA